MITNVYSLRAARERKRFMKLNVSEIEEEFTTVKHSLTVKTVSVKIHRERAEQFC